MAGRFRLSKIEVRDFTSFFDFWRAAIDFDLPRLQESQGKMWSHIVGSTCVPFHLFSQRLQIEGTERCLWMFKESQT
jgi:hypothetical protein